MLATSQWSCHHLAIEVFWWLHQGETSLKP